MKRTEIEDYVAANKLLRGVDEKPGVYAITVDRQIVYVGMGKNLYQRCCQHIYNTQNAMLNQEHKYLLLLSAQLGGHQIDCIPLEYCDIELLRDTESWWIENEQPILNILTSTGKQDIIKLKIEDLLAEVKKRRTHLLNTLGIKEE